MKWRVGRSESQAHYTIVSQQMQALQGANESVGGREELAKGTKGIRAELVTVGADWWIRKGLELIGRVVLVHRV